MTYAATADIQARVAQFTISATSKPTTTQVGLIQGDISHDINVALGSKGITTPFADDGSEFYDWLGAVEAWGTTAELLKSMFPNATGPAETPAYAYYEKRYQAAIKGILDGSLIPSTVSTSALRASTYFTRNPDSNEDLGDIAEPSFKVDKKW